MTRTPLEETISSPKRGQMQNPTTTHQDALDVYFNTILTQIEKHKVYPDIEKKRGRSGTVALEVSLNRDGSLKDIQMISSSKNRNLDQAAQKAVLNAAPFPPIPIRFEEKTLSLSINIVFSLRT